MDWTEEEAETLMLMVSERTAWADIAERFDRSVTACKLKARRCGVVSNQKYERWESDETLDDPAERKCLSCGGMFQSANRGNRLCHRCLNTKIDTREGLGDAREQALKLPELMQ
jgi:hypothetical protein